MEAYQNLRQWLYRFRRKYRGSTRKTAPLVSGLPNGLDHTQLTQICRENFSEGIASVSHSHLSGWKSSGAYRLQINTPSGKQIFLIYKNAVYDSGEIPALIDFPLAPGPPEFTIISQAKGILAAYLPAVYLADEVVPGKHYRYLLEDLHLQYRPIKGDADKELVIQQLPGLHQALSKWSQQASPEGFLQYGSQFSARLQTYARSKLEQLQQREDLPTLNIVLHEWQQIAAMHLQPSFFTQPAQLIHGDSNYTNFHVGLKNPRTMKVVDWEWAGFGSPYADLASINKGSQSAFEQRSYRMFCEATGDCRPVEHGPEQNEDCWRRYQWSALERGIMDAAFLSAQYLDAPNEAMFHIPDAIEASLRRMVIAYRQLADTYDPTRSG